MHNTPFAIAAGLTAMLASGMSMPATAAPVINELMYRPGTGYPENTQQEYIEIFNPAAAPVNIGGWALTSGVSYTFPAGTTIPAGGFLVVAANPSVLGTIFGSVSALGPWTAGASLSNNGEKVALSMPGATAGTWTVVDEVTYGTEGDWAQRYRETNFNGWDWATPANGGGKSLEVQNPALSNDNGQNWTASTAASGGTPGAANSVLTSNVPPVIHNVKHSPAVPLSTESVTISCEVNDEAGAASRTATLFYRNATATSPPPFTSQAMTNDGAGRFSVVLPPAADKAIFEFYISSTDGAGTRTWPAPATTGQVANCQYQVDNEVSSPGADTYRLILTAAENSAFNNVSSSSDRQFNLTLISTRGTDDEIRYQASMRIRGNSSRTYQFRPLRISVLNDDPLDGGTRFNLNPRSPHMQYIGMRLAQASGLPACDTMPVELRRNGVESTTSSGNTPDYGRWARMEDYSSDMVARHWPHADSGNIYKKGRPDEFWRSTGSAPNNPDGLIDGWSKQNNGSANDWSDLTEFFAKWQLNAAPHFPGAPANDVSAGSWGNTSFTSNEVADLNTVADLDQWARWFAFMTLINDNETNISNGQDDDYAAYFVPSAGGQRRMQLLPHDLDTILGRGDDTSTHGLYDMTAEGSVFEPLLPLIGNSITTGNAEFRTKYHNAIRELCGTVFNTDPAAGANPPFNAFVDNHLTGWAPLNVRSEIKTYMNTRRSTLLGLIGSGAITPPAATSTSTLTQTHGALIISEVLASNTAAHSSGGLFPDVIELRNTGASTINLDGKSLSDDPALKDKFVFAAGTQLAAGAHLIVYADSNFAGPGLHTGFQLDQGGDAVYLYESAAGGQALIDSVVFGPQVTDLSIGRTGANLNTWALCTPTVGAVNTAVTSLGSPGTLRINEWLGNPDFRIDDDFVEIHNASALPVPMGGMKITDDFINLPSQHILPALSFAGPGAFQVYKAKGGKATPGNPSELPFSIDATFGGLALIGANGTLVDVVDTVSQPRDQSTGRTPDSDPVLATQTVPSPGLSNGTVPAAYLALLNGLRITEVLYKPNGGNDYEFVELGNIGATALNLEGVRFTNGIDYVFPAGATIAPGAYLVVARNRTVLLSRFPAAGPILAPGQYTGALDNNGETLAISLPAPWDVAILNFKYEITWEPLTFNAGYSLTAVDENGTAPRDWNERESWTVSSVVDGTPGSVGPPAITSALAAGGIKSEVFTYQITGTRGPTLYSATGLPQGLTVNAGTGRITGSPSQDGVFNVTIGASNTAGTGTATLVLTVASSGPVHHFTWDMSPVSPEAGVPFAAWITARDDQERPVLTFNGVVPVTARAATGGVNTSTVCITEVTDEAEDQFELQNTGDSAVNTNGWFVRVNNSSSVNDLNPVTWPLPPSVAPGETLRVSELNQAGRLHFGGGISWTVALNRGWVMLFDNNSVLRDFFAWGWSQTELAALNITIGGAPVTIAGQWTGAGSPAGARGANNSWQRTGTKDTDMLTDWAFSDTPSWGATNAGLSIPWSAGTLVNISPATASFTGGVFTGYFTIPAPATVVRIVAEDALAHSGQSAAFDVVTAQADTDGDKMPNAWETANGLNPSVNDAAGDADHDGLSNRAEYYAGTNPRSFASGLKISSASLQPPSQVNIAFPVSAGRLYRISYSTALSSWAYVPGQTFAPVATGTQNATFPQPAGTGNRVFYRVELITPP